jgi:hypothetical protein
MAHSRVMIKFGSIGMLSCSAMLAVPSDARAQYGAIAASLTGPTGIVVFNSPTQEDADAVALQKCRVRGCQIVARFGPGNCGYVTVRTKRSRGTCSGWSATPAGAVAACQQRGCVCESPPKGGCND